MSSFFVRYTPKLFVCLGEGYSRGRFAGDVAGGVTVAIIALPLAMAIGIASIPPNVAQEMRAACPWLTPPAMGLFTVVTAGLVISVLGGSRVQIGGPTAAFMPIVFEIASEHGYAGLLTATAMAGIIVVLMGLFRFGQLIKFVPYPVTTGFTAGIAVTLLASQIKDFLGLDLKSADGQPLTLPVPFVSKLQVLAAHLGEVNLHATAVGAVSLGVLILLRWKAPRIPGAIVAVTLSAILTSTLGWAKVGKELDGALNAPLVETVGSRFGGIPDGLPAPQLPAFSFELIQTLMPAATTIAVLCAIESLLSAVVADGMTGYRHRSDQELIAQGVANVTSALFFGLLATGAIARTAANIKSGGQTPIAGMIHCGVVLAFMLALAPLAKAVPLPALAAVLIMVAWNICEIDHFRALLRAPREDVLALLSTFGLTVFTDLTIGVGVGVVLASFLFMKRMAETSTIAGLSRDEDQEPSSIDLKDPGLVAEKLVPPSVEVYEINGPFFFGVADRLSDVLRQLATPPRVFILRMRYVPHIDATAMHALDEFLFKCRRQQTTLLLGGVHIQPLFEMTRSGLLDKIGRENVFENLDGALDKAAKIIQT